MTPARAPQAWTVGPAAVGTCLMVLLLGAFLITPWVYAPVLIAYQSFVVLLYAGALLLAVQMRPAGNAPIPMRLAILHRRIAHGAWLAGAVLAIAVIRTSTASAAAVAVAIEFTVLTLVLLNTEPALRRVSPASAATEA